MLELVGTFEGLFRRISSLLPADREIRNRPDQPQYFLQTPFGFQIEDPSTYESKFIDGITQRVRSALEERTPPPTNLDQESPHIVLLRKAVETIHEMMPYEQLRGKAAAYRSLDYIEAEGQNLGYECGQIAAATLAVVKRLGLGFATDKKGEKIDRFQDAVFISHSWNKYPR